MQRIALLGMPNTGKSTFFNRLTGADARVGNWPGITVDLTSAKIILGGALVEVVDLPGIYSLHGFSEDEQVVRHFLEHNPVNLVAVIANGTQLDRQLSLVLQLKELGLPAVLLLNMADDVKRQGIKVEEEVLAEVLESPVAMLSAKYGQGFPQAKRLLEESIAGSAACTANLDAFAGDDNLESQLEGLVNKVVHIPVTFNEGVTGRIDRLLLHPWFGLPMFLLIMYLMFEAVYTVGTPLQDGMSWLLEVLRDGLMAPLLSGAPAIVESFFLEGLFDGVGTVLTFLPIIIMFFLFLAIVEDSGYLSRAAFLMDAFMARLGLDGRSFVMQLMGFGCNVPAIMGTRVMRSRGLRLLTMLIIPFALCSARLQVFVFLTAAVFAPGRAPLVLFSLYLMSFFSAFLTAFLYQGRLPNDDPLMLELPPYRFPTLRQMWLRSWHESKHFLRQASGFIVLGVVLVWFLTHYPTDVEPASVDTLAGQLASWLEPIFLPLGIDNLLSIALLFGFVAKEVVIGSMAVIYGAGEESLTGIMAAQIDWIEAYSFMLFVLIYTPCLATVAVIRQESRSWAYTAMAVAWPLGLAWVVSFVFYQVASRLF
ncbi:MAG: ferrous iron transport protein B [Gammaproteobacteria bacterium]|nr:ferrous iron transport protein B [Gammaproteobacteria bacterium]